MSQEIALEKIRSGENVAILGKAGTGKSYTFDQVTDDQTVRCAPTGIAALNIGGMTCHKMFNLPVGKPKDEDYFIVGKVATKLFNSQSPIKRILLDEVGMLRADYLDMIDSKLRTLRRNTLPFGGLQMIVGGDFYQLEPILPRNEQRAFRKKYKSPFSFDADAWNFENIELTKVYRQKDARQVAILDNIRTRGKWLSRAIEKIQSGAKEYNPTETTLHLCAYKRDAEIINNLWYKKLNSREFTFLADNPANWSESECIVPHKIRLKVGCRVLIKANDIKYNNYVNGDRGVFKGVTPDGELVILLDSTGCEVYVGLNTWEKYSYETTGGEVKKVIESEYKQYPVLLGYGITTHNSQGMTLDDVAIDFGQGCFSHGQAYVALSRIRDLSNISFVSEIYESDIIVDEAVEDFYNKIRGY